MTRQQQPKGLMPKPEKKELRQMLSTKRPAGSQAEQHFIQSYLWPLGVQTDAIGNLHKQVGESNILWSSHTDTVHRESGFQRPKLSGSKIKCPEDSNCLGADDTAGVWLMIHMIRAGVPGHYIFHRAEEVGGQGSTWLADEWPDWLSNFNTAIAFDRRGTQHIVTSQGLSNSASQHFARSLARSLGLNLQPASGIFTDTANYMDLVPECSNISVGFSNEHTSNESLDLIYLHDLKERMCRSFSESDLVIERDPEPVGLGGFDPNPVGLSAYLPKSHDLRATRLADLVAEHPEAAADLLLELGLGPDDLEHYIDPADKVWV